MSFPKEQKRLNEQLIFNPPPGYYEHNHITLNQKATSFAKSKRFQLKDLSIAPGPGHYNNNQKEITRKRLIQQSQKREVKINDSNSNNNIKISSIPSIPKKSATRVYEELAPGILILHQQEHENTSVGPASYNITDKQTHPKPKAHKIAPEHRKRFQEEEMAELSIPTIAEEIRNERRQMYKQNLIKSSTVNKSQISPSDLCLEVIILREKLLRSDDNPPPGYYHNEHLSAFKNQEGKKEQENQILGGKEKRFHDNKSLEVGPGAYELDNEMMNVGGFIARSPRRINAIDDNQKPGPGAYIKQKPKVKQENKAVYPPIFGSGCTRFLSAPKNLTESLLPGPGSYKIDKQRHKKQKYIKIKRQFLEQKSEYLPEMQLELQTDFSQVYPKDSVKERKFYPTEKCSSNFISKVERFQSDKSIIDSIGPGNYEIKGNDFNSKSFNRKGEGYIGSKMARFDQTEIRPKIGPGTYNPAYETVKQKKIINICI